MKLLEKSGVFLSIAAIIVLLGFIIFAKYGIMDYKSLREKEARIAKQAARIEEKNRRLEAEVERLKADLEYIKHVAKHEYEMIEKDEIIFKDVPKRKKE